jgi:hypothetical protein
MADDRNILEIDAGPLTEDLVSYVTEQLDDETLDQIEVGRELDRPDDFASEPITISVILIFTTTAAVIEVGRMVERWIEKKRQEGQVNLLIKAYTVSTEAGEAVEKAVAKHSEVAKVMPLPEHPDYTKFNLAGGHAAGG